jgi:hypothetical protein
MQTSRILRGRLSALSEVAPLSMPLRGRATSLVKSTPLTLEFLTHSMSRRAVRTYAIHLSIKRYAFSERHIRFSR